MALIQERPPFPGIVNSREQTAPLGDIFDIQTRGHSPSPSSNPKTKPIFLPLWISLGPGTRQSSGKSKCQSLSPVPLSVTLRTAACQATLSMGSPRILEWVAIPFSRGSSRRRHWTLVFCTAAGFLTVWVTREALPLLEPRAIQSYSNSPTLNPPPSLPVLPCPLHQDPKKAAGHALPSPLCLLAISGACPCDPTWHVLPPLSEDLKV